jgi:predicted flap endonuclease-1-like 5' DNA nuclease
MRKAENVNAPDLGGWLIGAAAGLVAFGALVVIGKFDLTPAVAIAGVVALLAGLILGMPWGAGDAKRSQPAADAAPHAAPAVAAHRAAEPKAEAMPAAFVSSPAPEPKAKPAAAPKAAVAPKAKAAPKAAAKPAAAPKAAAKPKVAKPAGPERLKAPRKGKADDLKEIEGIGPALEKLVNGMGFFHFDQIASWSDADVALVDGEMTNFKGRITRDKWVAQAKIIVSEGLEAFRERAKTNNY